MVLEGIRGRFGQKEFHRPSDEGLSRDAVKGDFANAASNKGERETTKAPRGGNEF